MMSFVFSQDLVQRLEHQKEQGKKNAWLFSM